MKRLYEGNLSELIDTIRCDQYIDFVIILKFYLIRTSFDRRNSGKPKTTLIYPKGGPITKMRMRKVVYIFEVT